MKTWKRLLFSLLAIIGLCLFTPGIYDPTTRNLAIWQHENIIEDLTPKNVYNYLIKSNVLAIDVVFRQILHETGHLTSRLCKEENNLFGMLVPWHRETVATRGRNGYAKFINWKQSIDDYKLWQEHQLENGKDLSYYYAFLMSIQYSKNDPSYPLKLQRINIEKYKL